MGSCMSCKAKKSAFAYTAAGTMDTQVAEPEDGVAEKSPKGVKRQTPYTRGQVTSFGFKRRTPAAMRPRDTKTTSSPAGSQASSPSSSGRSTPKQSRPTSKFGFRGDKKTITTAIPDKNCNIVISNSEEQNGNTIEQLLETPVLATTSTEKKSSSGCYGHSRPNSASSQSSVGEKKTGAKSRLPEPTNLARASRYTLQTRQLPQAQVAQIIRPSQHNCHSNSTSASKTAKTAANRKVAASKEDTQINAENVQVTKCQDSQSPVGEAASPDDSGVSTLPSDIVSSPSNHGGETDSLQDVEQIGGAEVCGPKGQTITEQIEDSPKSLHRVRTLEMVVNSHNGSFELREKSEVEHKESKTKQQQPSKLTSRSIPTPMQGGIVRQRAIAYQKHNCSHKMPTVVDKRVSKSDLVSHKKPSTTSSSETVLKKPTKESKLKPPSQVTKEIGQMAAKATTAPVKKRSKIPNLSNKSKLPKRVSAGQKKRGNGSDDSAEEKVHRDSTATEKTNRESGADSPLMVEVCLGDTEEGELVIGESTEEEEEEDVEEEESEQISESGDTFPTSDNTLVVGVTPRKPFDKHFRSMPASDSTLTAISPLDQSADSLFSSSEANSASDPLPVTTPKDGNGLVLSPTPTSTSASLSESEQKEFFLIDDEIADQPGLTFAQPQIRISARTTVDHSMELGAGESLILPDQDDINPLTSVKNTASPARRSRSRNTSMGTLSPCDSIASDDMMLDFERSDGSVPFDHVDRLYEQGAPDVMATLPDTVDEGEEGGEEDEGDDTGGEREEGEDGRRESSSDCDLFQEWATLVDAHSASDSDSGLVGGRPSRLLRSRASSASDPARNGDSRTTKTFTGSLRPPRQMAASEFEHDGVKLDRSSYQYVYQDVLNLKTMLLKLKRVLHEPTENGLLAETLNPFDCTLKNGLYYNLANSDPPVNSAVPVEDTSQSPREEMADLRRQVVFLQQQMEEKDRTIRLLQQQMTKYSASKSAGLAKETCNVATQTERIRPVSTGGCLAQSYPAETAQGPLVSLTDNTKLDRRKSKLIPKESTQGQRKTVRQVAGVNETFRSGVPKRIPDLTKGVVRVSAAQRT